jgi:hypothetical protein
MQRCRPLRSHALVSFCQPLVISKGRRRHRHRHPTVAKSDPRFSRFGGAANSAHQTLSPRTSRTRLSRVFYLYRPPSSLLSPLHLHHPFYSSRPSYPSSPLLSSLIRPKPVLISSPFSSPHRSIDNPDPIHCPSLFVPAAERCQTLLIRSASPKPALSTTIRPIDSSSLLTKSDYVYTKTLVADELLFSFGPCEKDDKAILLNAVAADVDSLPSSPATKIAATKWSLAGVVPCATQHFLLTR